MMMVSFKITGSGGDPGGYSWSKPDVYVRVVSIMIRCKAYHESIRQIC